MCGDGHVESFVGLLNERGISCRIVARAIGVNDEDKYTLGIALDYLQKHHYRQVTQCPVSRHVVERHQCYSGVDARLSFREPRLITLYR